MAKVVESRLVFKGDDRGAIDSADRVTKRLEALGESLLKISNIPYLDATKFERVESSISKTVKNFESLMRRSQNMTGGVRGVGRAQTPKDTTGAGVFGNLPVISGPLQGGGEVSVRVINWPQGFGGQGQVQLRETQHMRRLLEDQSKEGKKEKKQPADSSQLKSWMLRAPQTAVSVAGATAGGAGGAGELVSMAGKGISGIGGVNPIAMVIAGIIGGAVIAAGSAVAMAEHLAQPAFQYGRVAAPLYYRRPGGRASLEKFAEEGVKYGYGPQEMVGLASRLERVGAMEATPAAMRLRLHGFEPEDIAPYYEAITRGGAAGGRTPEDYSRANKELAILFAEKGQLPSIAQAMEQLVALTTSGTDYLGTLSTDMRGTYIAMTKAGEISGSALFKGGAGARTIQQLTSAFGGSQDPAMRMYSTMVMMQNADLIRSKVGAEFLERRGIPGKGQLSPLQLEALAETPQATMLIASTLMKTQGPEAVGYMLRGQGWGASKALEATHILEKYQGDFERAQSELKQRGLMEEEPGKVDPKDYRAREAEIEQLRLQTANQVADEVLRLNKTMTTALNDNIAPLMEKVTRKVADIADFLIKGKAGQYDYEGVYKDQPEIMKEVG